MNSKPSISVLMAVYNGEKYLREAVDSILSQTFTNYELIIVNDASTDSTKRILNTFKDKRIHIINNEQNIGLTKSLNKGLSVARGQYVARIDADDISMPGRLDIQKRFLDNHGEIACVGSSAFVINDRGEITGNKKSITEPTRLAFQLLIINQIIHSSCMFRLQTIKEQNGYNENFKFTQDYELWSRLSRNGIQLSNIDQPLIKYRYHLKSITQNADSKNSGFDLAIQTTKNNIFEYIHLSDAEFRYVIDFFHRYSIKKFACLVQIEKFISRLALAYIFKHRLNYKKAIVILTESVRQMKRALLCYIQNWKRWIKIKYNGSIVR